MSDGFGDTIAPDISWLNSEVPRLGQKRAKGPCGVHFCTMTAENQCLSKKVVLTE